jgi:Ni2+-binding GTPase involved in maturation of urease and hydrogenase
MSPKPRLIIVAGPNGSGKTTITEHDLPKWIARFSDGEAVKQYATDLSEWTQDFFEQET